MSLLKYKFFGGSSAENVRKSILIVDFTEFYF